MGNVEALGAEGTASDFYVKGMRQAGQGQLQEAGYCKFMCFDI